MNRIEQNGDWKGSLKNILSAIRIDSQHQFSFGGRIVPVVAAHHHQGNQGTTPMLGSLSGQLYEFAYSRPFREHLPEPNGSGFATTNPSMGRPA